MTTAPPSFRHGAAASSRRSPSAAAATQIRHSVAAAAAIEHMVRRESAGLDALSAAAAASVKARDGRGDVRW